MFLTVEKAIRGGKCHSIYRYAKANSKYMKDYDKNEKSPYRQYWDESNLYRWAMSQKLPVKNFKLVKGISKFDESLIKMYIFLKLMFKILKHYMAFTMIYQFYLKG